MVDLRRRGRYAHLNILLGTQLQVTLQTRGGVLRPLPFITMRQQHGQAAQASPLVLAAGDELVDHDLSTVGEVTELGFPDHQSVRHGGRIAVFECQHGFFGEEGIVQVEARLAFVQVLQRDVGAAVLLVVQRRMAMREGTATDVLTTDADRVAFEQQGRVGQRLGIAPVDGQCTGTHLLAVFENLRYLALDDEAFGHCKHLAGEFLQGLQIEPGIVTRGPGMAQVGTPVDEQLLVGLLDQALDHVQTVVQRGAVLVDLRLHALGVLHIGLDQAVGIQLARGALLGDLLVHQRLGTARLIGLVVAAAAVADQIDHHIALELHAIIDGQLGDEQHGLRIIGVHVEDRRLDHFRHVGGVLRGARIFLLVGSEANLVVDHDADGAARAIGAGLRHLEGFHDHALTSDGSVTVDGHRKDLVADRIATAVLAGAHRTFDHRGNDFQVGWVEGHGQVNLATGRHHVGGKALVILHVTGTQTFHLLAFELVEQVARVLAEGIDQYVQATAVGHADDDFLGAIGTGTLDDLVQQRNQALATFQTKTLGPRILGTQILFQTFGGGQALEQVALDFRRESRTTTNAFQTLHEPVALLRIDDVREFGANGATVCLLQRLMNFTQRCLVLAQRQITGAEHGVQVRVGQTIVVDRKIGRNGTLTETERVELSGLVTAHAVSLNQAKDFDLLLLMLATDATG